MFHMERHGSAPTHEAGQVARSLTQAPEVPTYGILICG